MSIIVFTSYFSGALSEGSDFFPVKKQTFCYVYLISKCHIHFAVLQNVNYFTEIRQQKRFKRRETNKNSKPHLKVYIDLNCNTVLLPAGAAAVLLLFFCDESLSWTGKLPTVLLIFRSIFSNRGQPRDSYMHNYYYYRMFKQSLMLQKETWCTKRWGGVG